MAETLPHGSIGSVLGLCRRHFYAAAAFSALVNLLHIAPTLYMLQVYERVVPTGGLLTLVFLTVVVLFALATLAMLDRVRSRLLVRASVKIDAELAPLILDATIGRPNAPVARRALREFDTMRQTLTGPGTLAIFDAPWTPIYVVVCFIVHPWIGALALVGVVVLPAIAWLNERATRSHVEDAQASASRSYTNQEALLGSADSVRALGMRRAMVARQVRQRDAMMTAQMTSNLASGTYLAWIKFVRLALQSLALGIGAVLAVDNQISAGAIFAASFLIARALAPIEALVSTWRTIAEARNSYKTVTTLLRDVGASTSVTRLPPPTGALGIEQMVVLNPARDGAIIGPLSVRIAAGEVIAIVGASGAGKSTLARAIAGARLPDRGAIRFDGAEQRDWDPERLARHIGYLPQESALFAGTIKENICRFDTEIEDDDHAIDAAVVAAAQKVGAHDLIVRLNGGYDYRLQLGGAGLSAGQTQRVALARAIYGNPSMLVLDEPNAHLDSDGDTRLIAALADLKAQGTTILIVSHKLSILPIVDKLLVLRDGMIEAFGPVAEVLPKVAPSNIRRVEAVAA